MSTINIACSECDLRYVVDEALLDNKVLCECGFKFIAKLLTTAKGAGGDVHASSKTQEKSSQAKSITRKSTPVLDKALDALLRMKGRSSANGILARVDQYSILSPLNSAITENTYLKIDTQGYDKNVLDGFKKNIKKIKFIQIEAGLYKLYENEEYYEYFINLFKSIDYELWDIKPFAFNKLGGLVQFDLIFRNKRFKNNNI